MPTNWQAVESGCLCGECTEARMSQVYKYREKDKIDWDKIIDQERETGNYDLAPQFMESYYRRANQRMNMYEICPKPFEYRKVRSFFASQGTDKSTIKKENTMDNKEVSTIFDAVQNVTQGLNNLSGLIARNADKAVQDNYNELNKLRQDNYNLQAKVSNLETDNKYWKDVAIQRGDDSRTYFIQLTEANETISQLLAELMYNNKKK